MDTIKNFREITINAQDLQEKGSGFLISQKPININLSPLKKVMMRMEDLLQKALRLMLFRTLKLIEKNTI